MRLVGYFAVATMLVSAPVVRAQEGTTPAAPAEAEAATIATEVVTAAPAEAPAAAVDAGNGVTVVAADEAKAGEDEDKTGFGLSFSLGHAIGTGTFVSNGELRERSNFVGQSWEISPSYKFNFMGQKLSASARFGLAVELTTPDSNPARRFDPSDIGLSLSAGKLWEEPVTGVAFGAKLSSSIPASYSSLYVRKQWTTLGASGNASRSFGPVDLRYSLGITKYFNSSAVPEKTVDVARESDILSRNDDGSFTVGAGFGNTSFALSNSMNVGYNATEQLSFGYSVGIRNSFKYDVAADDELTADFADAGRGRVDQLNSGIDVSYALSPDLEGVVDLPFDLSLSAGISTSHPAVKADNSGIMWPVFVNSFGANRAANNYGIITFDVTGSF